MANGTYGIRKPAVIRAEDIEIYYYYRPTRGSEAPGFDTFKYLSPDSVFTNCVAESGISISGLYNLRLPLEKFGRKGIYTIYIKPREMTAQIIDVSTLTGEYTNVRGVVFSTDVDGMPTGNGGLVGYRMDFLNEDGSPSGEYRIITSSNLCEPVAQNTGGSSTLQKGIRYRFNDSSELVFCTVTPSTSSFNPNATPYIGVTGEIVKLVNTKFNPVVIEIEMTTHDADTISTMLEGPQLRNLDNGIITTFDEDGNIYHQAAYGNIVNPNKGMHTDFKLPYEDSIVSEEENKLEEIRNQVRNG